MSTVDLSERDNKETLFVKEEVTNDAEVFGEVKVDVEGSQKEPLSSIMPPPGSSTVNSCLSSVCFRLLSSLVLFCHKRGMLHGL